MLVPQTLSLVSLSGVALAFLVPGLTDLLLIAVPSAIAALYLLLRALRPARWILLDGSNILHWKDGAPDIATVVAVVDHLTQLGYAPRVIFDANAGYKIADRYLNDQAFGRLLGLPGARVTVVAKGTPADPVLLAHARDLGARIVTNDRYRDWAEDHPEAGKPGHLVRGGFRGGKLWLDMDRAA